MPVRKVKMPRTVSISQQLANGFNSVREDKPQYETKVTKSVEVTGTDSFSVDAAFNVIKDFVTSHKISEARKPAFLTYKPEVKDIHNITLIIENPIQDDVIREYKGGLIKNLKQKLNNKNIDISTRMVKAKEAKRLLVTDKQRYDYLVEKYPAIDKLRKTFNLDLQ